jgi:hypothetical protein
MNESTKLSPKIRDWRETLEEFKTLEKGWDSYGGEPIGEKAIEAAGAILSSIVNITIFPPQPVPTADGGISLEWHVEGKEFSLNLDAGGRLESIFCEFHDRVKKGYYESNIDGSLTIKYE